MFFWALLQKSGSAVVILDSTDENQNVQLELLACVDLPIVFSRADGRWFSFVGIKLISSRRYVLVNE